MKHIYLTFLVPILLTSCSYFDEDSFNLVCDVNTETTSLVGGSSVKNNEKEIITWMFKNKKINVSNNYDIYKCSTWTKEQIGCDYDFKSDKSYRKESIRIDRMSGSIFYSKSQFDEELKTGSSKYSKGKCEKVKESKF